MLEGLSTAPERIFSLYQQWHNHRDDPAEDVEAWAEAATLLRLVQVEIDLYGLFTSISFF